LTDGCAGRHDAEFGGWANSKKQCQFRQEWFDLAGGLWEKGNSKKQCQFLVKRFVSNAVVAQALPG